MQSLARDAEMEWSTGEAQRMHHARLHNRTTLGDLPLALLARGEGDYVSSMSIRADGLERERCELQGDLANLSTRGTIQFVQGAGHNIHLEVPHVVIEAIRRITNAVRVDGSPTSRRTRCR